MSFYDRFITNTDPWAPDSGIGKSMDPVEAHTRLKGLYIVPNGGVSAVPSHVCMSEVTAADITDTATRFGSTIVRIGSTTIEAHKVGGDIKYMVDGRGAQASDVDAYLTNAIAQARLQLA
jgi:hypothetical protein